MDRAVNALIRIFICSENKRDSLNLILIYKIFILHCIKEIGFFIIYELGTSILLIFDVNNDQFS